MGPAQGMARAGIGATSWNVSSERLLLMHQAVFVATAKED
jgi:hypothetical protein